MEARKMKNGMIIKLIHKGQKVYGVITGFDDTNTTVRFPFSGVSGTVEIVEITVPKSDCRKPMHLGQDAEMATLIRQLVGVPLEKEGQ
jgi:ribosomal protein S1